MAKKGSDYTDKAFSVQLSEISDAIIGDVQEFIQQSVFEIYRGVTFKSPVLTGRFKGNWSVSVGSPLFSDDENATSTPYHENASNVTDGSLTNYLLQIDGTKPVYITNGLPYAARLETGYSRTQAPNGMVDVTLTEYRAFIAKNIGKSI